MYLFSFLVIVILLVHFVHLCLHLHLHLFYDVFIISNIFSFHLFLQYIILIGQGADLNHCSSMVSGHLLSCFLDFQILIKEVVVLLLQLICLILNFFIPDVE